jgi:hypothetical protein
MCLVYKTRLIASLLSSDNTIFILIARLLKYFFLHFLSFTEMVLSCWVWVVWEHNILHSNDIASTIYFGYVFTIFICNNIVIQIGIKYRICLNNLLISLINFVDNFPFLLQKKTQLWTIIWKFFGEVPTRKKNPLVNCQKSPLLSL